MRFAQVFFYAGRKFFKVLWSGRLAEDFLNCFLMKSVAGEGLETAISGEAGHRSFVDIGENPNELFFMIAKQERDILALLLQIDKIIDHAFAVRTTVDIISDEDDAVLLDRPLAQVFFYEFEKFFQFGKTAVNIADRIDPHIFANMRLSQFNCFGASHQQQ